MRFCCCQPPIFLVVVSIKLEEVSSASDAGESAGSMVSR